MMGGAYDDDEATRIDTGILRRRKPAPPAVRAREPSDATQRIQLEGPGRIDRRALPFQKNSQDRSPTGRRSSVRARPLPAGSASPDSDSAALRDPRSDSVAPPGAGSDSLVPPGPTSAGVDPQGRGSDGVASQHPRSDSAAPRSPRADSVAPRNPRSDSAAPISDGRASGRPAPSHSDPNVFDEETRASPPEEAAALGAGELPFLNETGAMRPGDMLVARPVFDVEQTVETQRPELGETGAMPAVQAPVLPFTDSSPPPANTPSSRPPSGAPQPLITALAGAGVFEPKFPPSALPSLSDNPLALAPSRILHSTLQSAQLAELAKVATFPGSISEAPPPASPLAPNTMVRNIVIIAVLLLVLGVVAAVSI